MNQNIYKGFKEKLQEMFMTDRADLDFGIYRIMNLKRKEIEDFLDNKLFKEVANILRDSIPKDSKMTIEDMENNIFSKLTEFFNRY